MLHKLIAVISPELCHKTASLPLTMGRGRKALLKQQCHPQKHCQDVHYSLQGLHCMWRHVPCWLQSVRDRVDPALEQKRHHLGAHKGKLF